MECEKQKRSPGGGENGEGDRGGCPRSMLARNSHLNQRSQCFPLNTPALTHPGSWSVEVPQPLSETTSTHTLTHTHHTHHTAFACQPSSGEIVPQPQQ